MEYIHCRIPIANRCHQRR